MLAKSFSKLVLDSSTNIRSDPESDFVAAAVKGLDEVKTAEMTVLAYVDCHIRDSF